MKYTVSYGDEARKKLVAGVNKLADAVKVTLGAKGRHVIISKNLRMPHATKDGATVARDFFLTDEIENTGAQIVKEAAIKTLKDAGDGTTTSTILAQALVSYGMEKITSGQDAMEVKSEIDTAVKQVVDKIKSAAIPVKDYDTIKKVATIAANNDEFIGGLIAEAYEKIGFDGVLSMDNSNSTETHIKVVNGLELDRGFLNPHFINTNSQTCELQDCKVLIFEKKLTSANDLMPILTKVGQLGAPILIMCEDLEGEAGASLVLNKLKGLLSVCCIKLPGAGAARKELLDDIISITGGKIIGPERGLEIKNCQLTDLGSLKRVSASKDTTLLVGHDSAKESTLKRVADLKSGNTDETVTKRIAALTSGIAVIHVGGVTEIELAERKDRVDDAIRATKSAIEEGIVAGGGICLSNAGKNILKGVENAPLLQMIQNCGLVPSIIYDKLHGEKTYGYNCKTGEYGDMIDMGIIDAAKVVRCALENAASVACVILTCECIVAEEKLE